MSDENANPDENRDGNKSEDDKQLEIVRAKDRTIHVSPTNRKKQEDYVIQNFTGVDQPFVFIPLPDFKRDLTVTDADGTILSVYPNRIVSESLDELEEANGTPSMQATELSEIRNNSIFIQFQEEKPLKTEFLRTIRLDYEQSDQVNFRNFRKVRHGLKYAFFDIPYFAADVQRSPDEKHDIFIIVVGTPGYKIEGKSNRTGENVEDTTGHEIYENGINDNTRNLSIRLPAPKEDNYSYRVEYELIPSNRNLLFALELYWIVTAIAGVLSLYFALRGVPQMAPLPTWFQDFSGLQTAFSAGVVSGTLGIIFALKKEWADRYRILCIVIVIIHTLAWIIWTNAGITFP
jgi:hypothetical protein